MEADGVVFDFRHSMRAPTSTTVHSGQFPELYFEVRIISDRLKS